MLLCWLLLLLLLLLLYLLLLSRYESREWTILFLMNFVIHTYGRLQEGTCSISTNDKWIFVGQVVRCVLVARLRCSHEMVFIFCHGVRCTRKHQHSLLLLHVLWVGRCVVPVMMLFLFYCWSVLLLRWACRGGLWRVVTASLLPSFISVLVTTRILRSLSTCSLVWWIYLGSLFLVLSILCFVTFF